MTKVVKEITQSVFDAQGNEVMAPGTQVPADAYLPPDVRWRHVVVDGPPAPPDEPAAKDPAPARHATVKAAPAEGKGSSKQ